MVPLRDVVNTLEVLARTMIPHYLPQAAKFLTTDSQHMLNNQVHMVGCLVEAANRWVKLRKYSLSHPS
jgi:hypothetical protein